MANGMLVSSDNRFDLKYFEKHYSDGVCKRDRGVAVESMYEWDDYYEIQSIPKSDVEVCSQKLFFSDTLRIMKEGCFLKHGGLKIGKWRSYDKAGKLVEETNEDEGWNITWKELEPKLLEMKIRPNTIMEIEREVLEEDIHIWRVSVFLSLSAFVVLTFSGETGEFLFSEVEQLSFGSNVFEMEKMRKK